jgi:Domain of unknown function (DUF4070)
LPALLDLRTRPPLTAMWRHGAKLLPVLMKEIYHFGISDDTLSFCFWKTFIKILRKNPLALESFVFDTAFFHHLHQHADYVQNEIDRYLSDVLFGISRYCAATSTSDLRLGESLVSNSIAEDNYVRLVQLQLGWFNHLS